MKKTGGILKNAMVVAVLTALSRLLGLVREMLQSRLFGAGLEQSAFAVAFSIPNMARRMFGEGCLTAAFVPIFQDELSADASLQRARRLARAVLTMTLLILMSIVILVWCLLAPEFWRAVAPGVVTDKVSIIFRYLRILIPYMVFICGAAFGMGVLNAFGKFAAAACMPSILNVVWITALATLFIWQPTFTSPENVVADRLVVVCVAILVAGLFQFAFMLNAMRKKGVSFIPQFTGWRSPKVRLVWRNMILGCMGAGVVQINYMLDQVLAVKASDWAAGVLGYADRLMELPLGVVGTAFGTVLLATLSRYFSLKDLSQARVAVLSSTRNMLLVVLPAAVGLVVLAPELTSLVYRGGRFDDWAVLRVSRAVRCYSLGLAFFSFYKTLTAWFHAQQDVTTPLKVGVRMVVLNLGLNLVAVFCLTEEWRHVGLAASTVVCSGISCLWLMCLSVKKNGAIGWFSLVNPVARLLLASVIMGLGLEYIRHIYDGNRIINVALLVASGALFYFVALGVFGRDLLRAFVDDFRGRRSRRKLV